MPLRSTLFPLCLGYFVYSITGQDVEPDRSVMQNSCFLRLLVLRAVDGKWDIHQLLQLVAEHCAEAVLRRFTWQQSSNGLEGQAAGTGAQTGQTATTRFLSAWTAASGTSLSRKTLFVKLNAESDVAGVCCGVFEIGAANSCDPLGRVAAEGVVVSSVKRHWTEQRKLLLTNVGADKPTLEDLQKAMNFNLGQDSRLEPGWTKIKADASDFYQDELPRNDGNHHDWKPSST